uniref:Uncharacterized protein n=2 Tax=unclassified Caudoviricetes TaxID=2788787 RepID=A0A8S5Q134_9CAUD|nr:MAG TPA: hypothetical protein [Siphoviridae sp. ctkL634]DAE12373.1 MAG TPA: hypothetical protein [Siphoviridae sp. ctG0D7]
MVYVNIPVILSWEVASVVVSNLPFKREQAESFSETLRLYQ